MRFTTGIFSRSSFSKKRMRNAFSNPMNAGSCMKMLRNTSANCSLQNNSLQPAKFCPESKTRLELFLFEARQSTLKSGSRWRTTLLAPRLSAFSHVFESVWKDEECARFLAQLSSGVERTLILVFILSSALNRSATHTFRPMLPGLGCERLESAQYEFRFSWECR